MCSLFFGYWPTLLSFSCTHSHTWHLSPDWWLMTLEVFQQGPPRVKITCHKYRSSKIPFSRHSSICTCCSISCVRTCARSPRCARARNLDSWLWKHLEMCPPSQFTPTPFSLQSFLCMWGAWEESEGNYFGNTFQNAEQFPLFSPATLLDFLLSSSVPLSSPSPVQQTEELPQLFSNLHRELFPRVETLSSFFSPLSPLPPFISVKGLPWGKLSSATICIRWAKGSPAKKKKKSVLFYLLYPSTFPFFQLLSSRVPSHNPTHTLRPHASKGQSPKPIAEEFPCWNSYKFQRLQALSTVC